MNLSENGGRTKRENTADKNHVPTNAFGIDYHNVMASPKSTPNYSTKPEGFCNERAVPAYISFRRAGVSSDGEEVESRSAGGIKQNHMKCDTTWDNTKESNFCLTMSRTLQREKRKVC
jgi:hypothetical protein